MKEFRQEVRDWLEENCPPSMRTPMPENERVWGGRRAEFINPDSKVWLDRIVMMNFILHMYNPFLDDWLINDSIS